jgi:hypothetical protein
MNSRRVNDAISRHVTTWFHREGYDGFAPDIIVTKVCTLFLEKLKRCKLTLFLSEGEFRRNICEAVCTIYMTHKQNTSWSGPHSDAPRPPGWTSQNEFDWKDWLNHEYFSYETWGSFWSQIPEGNWEMSVPYWRDSMQYILLHYIDCEPDMVDSYDGNSPTEEAPPPRYESQPPRRESRPQSRYDSD